MARKKKKTELPDKSARSERLAEEKKRKIQRKKRQSNRNEFPFQDIVSEFDDGEFNEGFPLFR